MAATVTVVRVARLTLLPGQRSVLYMPTIVVDNTCYLCEHDERDGVGPFEFAETLVRGRNRYKAYRCVDRKACAARQALSERLAIQDGLTELAELRETLKDYRASVKRTEAEIAEKVRSLLSDGAGATETARAAGVSRERVYQLRDGRR